MSQKVELSGHERTLQIDILRGLAVLLVLGRHILDFSSRWHSLPFAKLLKIWQTVGWIGVDLFFVLSGFLVSGLIFKEVQSHNDFRFSRFFLRRGLKIYPQFYTLLAATIVVFELNHHSFPQLESIVIEAVFLQNYFQGLIDQTYPFDFSWTLAIEEHFYLTLGLGCRILLFWQRSLHVVPLVCAIVIAAVVIFRSISFCCFEPYSNFTHRFPTHLRCDALAFGVLISYGWCYHKAVLQAICTKYRLAILLAALLLISPCARFGFGTWFPYVFGLSMLWLGFGLMVLLAICTPVKNNWLTILLGNTGRYSYSIYMWHTLVLVSMKPQIEAANLGYGLDVFLYFIGTLLASVILAKAIEFPILRFRDAKYPSRADSLEES